MSRVLIVGSLLGLLGFVFFFFLVFFPFLDCWGFFIIGLIGFLRVF